MSELQLRRVRHLIDERFSALIAARAEKPLDLGATRSRALAAFALQMMTDISGDDAAAAVVDSFDDNGFDAIHYSPNQSAVYIVQAKWSDKGRGGPDVSSVQKLFQGLDDLLASRWDRFNDAIRNRQAELAAALDNADCRFRLVFAHSGTQKQSQHVSRVVQDKLEQLNDIAEVFSFEHFGQKQIHQAVVGGTGNQSIDLEVLLTHWGFVDEPYRAVYGQVSAGEIAEWWRDHGPALVSRNLRGFLGDSDINRSMAATLRDHPERFWYFNNGITLLADSFKRKHLHSQDRRAGIFVCKGVSVVNGAQTVGTVAKLLSRGSSDTSSARVNVRILSLANCPPGFDAEITRATNNQNRIQYRDFVALDETQRRLAAELAINGVRYLYRGGDIAPKDAESCTLDEATVALACSNPELRLTVLAKSRIGNLWQDPSSPPYTELFNDGLTAERLWWSVEVARDVDAALAPFTRESEAEQRQIAIHGNRFVLRQVFRLLRESGTNHGQVSAEPLVKALVEDLEWIVAQELDDSYLAWSFKNIRKCQRLENALSGSEFPVEVVVPGQKPRTITVTLPQPGQQLLPFA